MKFTIVVVTSTCIIKSVVTGQACACLSRGCGGGGGGGCSCELSVTIPEPFFHAVGWQPLLALSVLKENYCTGARCRQWRSRGPACAFRKRFFRIDRTAERQASTNQTQGVWSFFFTPIMQIGACQVGWGFPCICSSRPIGGGYSLPFNCVH